MRRTRQGIAPRQRSRGRRNAQGQELAWLVGETIPEIAGKLEHERMRIARFGNDIGELQPMIFQFFHPAAHAFT